ncbi:MAG TPA: sigma-70 family RNA polymerase sigma factor, partial [Acidimicrobiales bacterium]|nr:sigma-70 family RNA polymerase sigma factor [Acidimicrobiales bacterium]
MTTLLTGGGTPGTEALDDDVDLARDRALVTRAQGGERGAFDDLYMRYYRRLYRFCLRRLHDSYEAEDVAQEAFVRAWRALPTFGGDRRFYPWLSVIASHLCTDVLRRRNRSTPVAEFHQSNVASTDDGGEEIMLAAVDSNLAAKAFTRLSDRHQRILKL